MQCSSTDRTTTRGAEPAKRSMMRGSTSWGCGHHKDSSMAHESILFPRRDAGIQPHDAGRGSRDLSPGILLYTLDDGQRRLEQAFPERIRTSSLTPIVMGRIFCAQAEPRSEPIHIRSEAFRCSDLPDNRLVPRSVSPPAGHLQLLCLLQRFTCKKGREARGEMGIIGSSHSFERPLA